jgi:hypothetical protein
MFVEPTREQKSLREEPRAYFDYPIRRFYLGSKQLEFSLGGASRQLEILGELVMLEAAGSGSAKRDSE